MAVTDRTAPERPEAAAHSPTRFLDRSTPPHIGTLVLMAGMSALVMNIFVPSLQMMADWFEADYALVQLSVGLYLGVNAVVQLFVGPMSDKFGRRPVILWGTAVFVLATLGCALATTITTFLVFRMIQAGIVVAMVLSRAVVRDLYPPDRAASMLGYVTMGMSIVPMLSPILGGVLSEVFGWQANFWLMFGLGIALFWLCWRDVGETAVQSGLTLRQQFSEYPELLRSPRFWGYALAAALSSGAFFSYVGGAAFVGEQVFGLDTSELGFFFGAPALGYALGNYLSGRQSARVGIDRMVLIGSVTLVAGLCISMAVFALGHGSAWTFFGFMTLVGLGNGMTLPNATVGAMSVRPHLAGTASGLAGAIMLAGGAALSSLAGVLLTPGAGVWPLLWLMALSSAASVVAILIVIRRNRRLRGLDLT